MNYSSTSLDLANGATIVDYILWRVYNQWAPHAYVPTRWEHKCASIAYIIKDGTKTGQNSYTYVSTTFCFKPRHRSKQLWRATSTSSC